MRFQKTICSALVAVALTGCASKPVELREFPAASVRTERDAAARMSDSWNNNAVERSGKAMLVLVTPFTVPLEIRSKQIRLELESGATIKDLVAVMGNLGYSIILADSDAGEKAFYLPRFSGTVGSLLSTVARATDVWFTWNDGTIVVSSSEKISVTLPQEEVVATKVADGLKALGIEQSAISWEAGMATMTVTPGQLSKVRTFLLRMTANAALVSLQVAILNVQMNHDTKQGVDWSKLQLAVGKDYAGVGMLNMDGFKPTSGNSSFVQPITTNPIGTPVATGTPVVPPVDATAPVVQAVNQALSAAALTGGGLKGVLTNSLFSFTGLYDYLQTYGATETKQNVVLKTIAGSSVELKSLTQTPYVESVSVTSTGTTNGAVGNNMGAAKTAKADDGITLKMTPTFDAAANTVTVKMELSLKAVLGFNSLSAGNQIGTLSQPTTAERSFNDVLRVRPGQTVVVGGITYDSVSDLGNSPNFMSAGSNYEHKAVTVNRNSMFIVVRPTVSSLGQLSEEDSPELFAPGKPESVPPKKSARPAKASAKKKVLVTVEVEQVPSFDAAGYATLPLRMKE